MTVLLAEFAKALLGEIAKEVWKDLGNRIRKLRAGGTVEFVYRGRTAQNILVDIVLTYPSARAMRADCRQRPVRVPLSPVSPGTRDPPGGAETDLRAARWREVGVGHLPRRWRQRGAEGSFPDRLGVLRDCSACSLSRRG